MRVTVDTTRAERMLKDTGRRVRKTNWRQMARPAAKIVLSDLEATAPKLSDGRRMHTFSRARDGYKIRIKVGNLRKSMRMFAFSRSKLMWVGSRYGVAKNGATIGNSKANSDGFYDKFLVYGVRPHRIGRGRHPGIAKNDYVGATARRTESQVKAALVKSGEDYVAKLVAKANATP